MTSSSSARARQRGISLMVVMVMLLLCSLLALGSARLTGLNEALVGNISDEQRAFLAAEALMRDAQQDIQSPELRAPNTDASGDLFFPLDAATDITTLQSRVMADDVPCRKGLCYPAQLDSINGQLGSNWWQLDNATARAMREHGATFGLITNQINANPLLRTDAVRLAHYWIEVFMVPPEVESMAGTVPKDRPFVYRVTAVVDGNKAGTRVVLQSIMTP